MNLRLAAASLDDRSHEGAFRPYEEGSLIRTRAASMSSRSLQPLGLSLALAESRNSGSPSAGVGVVRYFENFEECVKENYLETVKFTRILEKNARFKFIVSSFMPRAQTYATADLGLATFTLYSGKNNVSHDICLLSPNIASLNEQHSPEKESPLEEFSIPQSKLTSVSLGVYISIFTLNFEFMSLKFTKLQEILDAYVREIGTLEANPDQRNMYDQLSMELKPILDKSHLFLKKLHQKSATLMNCSLNFNAVLEIIAIYKAFIKIFILSDNVFLITNRSPIAEIFITYSEIWEVFMSGGILCTTLRRSISSYYAVECFRQKVVKAMPMVAMIQDFIGKDSDYLPSRAYCKLPPSILCNLAMPKMPFFKTKGYRRLFTNYRSYGDKEWTQAGIVVSNSIMLLFSLDGSFLVFYLGDWAIAYEPLDAGYLKFEPVSNSNERPFHIRLGPLRPQSN